MSKEAMKLALEALKQIDEAMPFPVAKLAQAALREALAEQPAQQEPAAHAVYHRMGGGKSLHWPEQHSPHGDANEYQLVPLYTSPPAQQEPVAHSIVAGALFDFMGWLTSRNECLVLSSTDDAAPAADAIKDFAHMRNMSIDDAKVREWQEHLASPPASKPLTDEGIDKLCPQFEDPMRREMWIIGFKAAHGIKEGGAV